MILSPLFKQRFLDANGDPLAGGFVYAYIAGTSTPQATYTDQGGGTANANPVVLDANGEADIWFDEALSYKVKLDDSDSVTQWTVDDVSGASISSVPKWDTNQTYSQGDIVADASGYGQMYVSLTDSNQGNALTSVSNWRSFDGRFQTVTSNTTVTINDRFIRSNTTSGALTHTLPAVASTPPGKRISIKDVGDGTYSTTVDGNASEVIDGAATFVLTQYSSATFINNGTSWDIECAEDAEVALSKIATSNRVVSTSDSGEYSTASSTYVAVTNLTASITTTGRPVEIKLIADTGATASGIGVTVSSGSELSMFSQFKRGSTSLGITSTKLVVTGNGAVPLTMNHPPSAYHTEDAPVAGTYTYTFEVKLTTGTYLNVTDVRLVVRELF